MVTNTFLANNGLVSFDWFDAANWSAGLPAAQDVLISYAPGFAYTLAIGTANVGANTNPAVSLGSLTLASPDATLQVNSNLTFTTLDLQAGTLTTGIDAPAPGFTGGTLLSHGGHLLAPSPLFFNNLTWLGDLSLPAGALEFSGSISFGPLPAGPRPVITLGTAAITFRGTDTLTGIDLVQTGTSNLTFGESQGTLSAGTIAADVSIAVSGVSNRLAGDALVNLGHIALSGGNLSAGPVIAFGGALLSADLTTFRNDGTIDLSNAGALSITAPVTGSGLIRIASGATLQPVSTVGLHQTIALLDGTGTVQFANKLIEADLTGFQAGDKLIVAPWQSGFTPTVSYRNGVLRIDTGHQQTTEVYIGTGYDPASFVITPGTFDFINGQTNPTVTTTTPVAPAFVPFAAPAPGPGLPGASTFIPTDGRFQFNFNDPANWTAGIPAAGQSGAITYAPGYAYQLLAGSPAATPASSPLFAPQSFTLDSPDATLDIATNMTFGTLDLKAGVLVPLATINGAPGAGDRVPDISGTILADGGLVDFTTPPVFKGVTWVGDLDMSGPSGLGGQLLVPAGGLTLLPRPGGGRPTLSLHGSLGYDTGQTLSGVDVVSRFQDSLAFSGTGTIAADASVTYSGTSTLILAYGTLTNLAPIVATSGTVTIGNASAFSGLMINNATLSAAGGRLVFVHQVNGTGAIHVSAGGVLDVQSPIGGGQSITFDDATGSLAILQGITLNSFLHGFRAGDTITIGAGTTATTPGIAYTGGILTVTTSAGPTAVPIGAGYDPASLHVTERQLPFSNSYVADITTTAPCFAAGTRLRTPRGDIPVEYLTPGDQVLAPDGTRKNIVWLGHRTVDCRRHPRPQDVWPIRVLPGAFGRNRPAHDLVLSPDHAIHVDGALIPVRYLANGATIRQEPAARITYWHVELPEHGILLAENLPCESYLDTGNRSAFTNGVGAIDLHPDFARGIWQARACAPLVLDGPRLIAARRSLLARAEALGHRLTADPALTIRADGRRLAPAIDGRRWHLRLPPATTRLALRTRTWTPSHTRPTEGDTRPLGVALADLRLDGRPIALDDPRLSSGWHPPEPDGRWTDGDAGLSLAGVRTVDFTLAMTGTYWRGLRARSREADGSESVNRALLQQLARS